MPEDLTDHEKADRENLLTLYNEAREAESTARRMQSDAERWLHEKQIECSKLIEENAALKKERDELIRRLQKHEVA